MSSSKETVLGMLRSNNPSPTELQQLENVLHVFATHSTELQKKQSIFRSLSQAISGVAGASTARFFYPSAVVGPLYATVAVVVAGTLASYGGVNLYDALDSKPKENWFALNAAIEKLLADRFSIKQIIEFINNVNHALQIELNNQNTRSTVKAVTTGVYPAVLGPHQQPLSIAIHATSANAFPIDKFFVRDSRDTDAVIKHEDQGLRQRRVPR